MYSTVRRDGGWPMYVQYCKPGRVVGEVLYYSVLSVGTRKSMSVHKAGRGSVFVQFLPVGTRESMRYCTPPYCQVGRVVGEVLRTGGSHHLLLVSTAYLSTVPES
jgi:hypothetical protein